MKMSVNYLLIRYYDTGERPVNVLNSVILMRLQKTRPTNTTLVESTMR